MNRCRTEPEAAARKPSGEPGHAGLALIRIQREQAFAQQSNFLEAPTRACDCIGCGGKRIELHWPECATQPSALPSGCLPRCIALLAAVDVEHALPFGRYTVANLLVVHRTLRDRQ